MPSKIVWLILRIDVFGCRVCDITESYNLAILAAHMFSPSKLLPLSCLRLSLETTSRHLLAMNNFYQADICLMRGLLSPARRYILRALSLLPGDTGLMRGERYQMMSILHTIQLLMKGVATTKRYKKTEPVIDRGSTAYSYVQLHAGVLEFARGNIVNAQTIVNRASTRTLRRDSSPLPLQVENLAIWLHYISGNPQLLNDFSRSLSSEDQLLRKLWSLELIAVIHLMKGDFTEARAVISKLSRLQMGRYGQSFSRALVGFISTFEGHHVSADVDERDECLNSIIFAANSLADRFQTSPIGIVSLFFSAYGGQYILNAYHRESTAGADMSRIIRKGGGLYCRLLAAVRRATECTQQAAQSFPLLQVLVDVLTMQRVRGMRMTGLERFHVDYFAQTPRREDMKQFVFGLAFWHHEKQLYCKYFNLTAALAEMDTALNRGQQSSDMESCFERLAIRKNHPIFGEDICSKIL